MKIQWWFFMVLFCFSSIVTGEGGTVISKLNGRPVVCEQFTGTWCTYCYGSSIALDRIANNYNSEDVIILSYHIYDDYGIDFGEIRRVNYSVTSEPTVWFNGKIDHVGGSAYADGETGITSVYNTYVSKITEEQARTSGQVPFELQLQGNVNPTDPEMTLRVTSSTGYAGSIEALFFITEDNIQLVPPAFNGQMELNKVVRAYLGTRTIYMPSPGISITTISHSGIIPHTSPVNLKPVVILQDMSTKEILGAVNSFSSLTKCTSQWRLYE